MAALGLRAAFTRVLRSVEPEVIVSIASCSSCCIAVFT